MNPAAATATASDEKLRAYYAQRASSYEEIYRKPERQADLRAMEAWLCTAFSGRQVLEIACGTGWWTQHGARLCAGWLATDLNPETLSIARGKPLPAGKVRFATVDAYRLDAPSALEAMAASTAFDAAFAGFWWSHVALSRLPGWLETLHARLAPGAKVVMLDNRFVPGSSTPIARRDAEGNTWQRRTLDDGSVHEVLKNFPSREQAVAALGPQARDAQWIEHEHYWLLQYHLR